MYEIDLGSVLAGVVTDDDDNEVTISGPSDFEGWVEGAFNQRSNRKLIEQLARGRAGSKISGSPLGKMVSRLRTIGKNLQAQTGRIEANYLRRPNNLASIYGTAIAAGATVSFSVTPAQGMSYYRVLGLYCSDEQSDRMGFTTLKIGGVEHVNVAQSTPTAPVANAVPWAVFVIRESSYQANLAPWSGQVFDTVIPITGTIANMTTAAATDVYTGAPRICIATQVDPCGVHYKNAQLAAAQGWKAMKGNLSFYGPLMG